MLLTEADLTGVGLSGMLVLWTGLLIAGDLPGRHHHRVDVRHHEPAPHATRTCEIASLAHRRHRHRHGTATFVTALPLRESETMCVLHVVTLLPHETVIAPRVMPPALHVIGIMHAETPPVAESRRRRAVLRVTLTPWALIVIGAARRLLRHGTKRRVMLVMPLVHGPMCAWTRGTETGGTPMGVRTPTRRRDDP